MDPSNLTAEEFAQRGAENYQEQDYKQAAEMYAQAEHSYQATGDGLRAAEMANNRSVALLQLGEGRAALDAVAETQAVFAAAGDTLLQAQALGNRAAALAALGRRDEAEQVYWDSASLLGDIGERELRGSVLQAISRLQLKGGRYGEAVATMESSLERTDRPTIIQRLLQKLLRIPMKMLGRGS